MDLAGADMIMKKHVRAIVAGVLASAGVVLGLQVPAYAAWPSDSYRVNFAYFPPTGIIWYYAIGGVNWSNRTAYVSGDVYDVDGMVMTSTVVFEAYAASTKIDSQTRTADQFGSTGSPRHYGFTIGDPDKPGGIDRIKITVRYNSADGSFLNGPTYQVHRDGVGELVGNM
jgi:hypothetical protein